MGVSLSELRDWVSGRSVASLAQGGLGKGRVCMGRILRGTDLAHPGLSP